MVKLQLAMGTLDGNEALNPGYHCTTQLRASRRKKTLNHS